MTKILIVDEVSMIDGQLLDKIDEVARAVRKDQRTFGGLQLVLCGDVCQLPPVGRDSTFFFEAKCWKTAVNRTVQLTRVFRQTDMRFVEILNEMRVGSLSEKSIRMLKSLSRVPSYPEDGIEPAQLFCLRQEVEQANMKRLADLPGPLRQFNATDEAKDDTNKKRLNDNSLAPQLLELKLNAQVMLLKNVDEKLVNGSLGRVIGFGKGTGNPIVQFVTRDGDVIERTIGVDQWTIEVPGDGIVACRKQIPLALAWAMSIHKSQGQTLPRVKVDLARVFESGQAYVALSRATSMDGLQVLNFDARKVRIHPKALEFTRNLQAM
jgi:ATP-dependent DNA helicase PIF1